MADEYTRCFVAIQVQRTAKAELTKAVGKLKRQFDDQVRWMGDDQLHLTLRFIGNLNSQELLQVCTQLHRLKSGVQHVSVPLSGMGVFPQSGPPRVVWAGISDADGSIRNIHNQLNACLAEIGFPAEGRNYTPHITLGRARNHTDEDALRTALQDVGETLSEPIEAGSIGLFATEKSTRSVQYACLDRIALR